MALQNEIQNAEKKRLKWKQTKQNLKTQLTEESQRANAFFIENQKLLDNIQRLTQRSQTDVISLQRVVEEQQDTIEGLRHKLQEEQEKSQRLEKQIESFEHKLQSFDPSLNVSVLFVY